MKHIIKKQEVILWIIGGCILYGITVHLIYGMEKEHLQAECTRLFRQAIDTDQDNRLQETGMPVYFGYERNKDDTASYIIMEDGHQIHHIKKTDSIRQLSYSDKQNLALQSALLQLNPINVHRLDSLFHLEWQKKDRSVLTAVRYTHHTAGETWYSDSDTLFYTSAFATEEILTGLDNEIILQGFVKIKPSGMVRHSMGALVGATLVWCVFVALVVYLPVRRRKKKLLSPSETTISSNQPQRTQYHLTEHICLDMDKQIVIYDDKEISLTGHLARLVECLYNSTDHYAGYDALISVLYGNINVNNGKKRLTQAIKRLRTELKSISGLTVKNVSRKGYRLQLPEIADRAIET